MDSNLKQTLAKFRQAYDTRLENGTLVPEKSQTAKNLLPVSSASGSTQTAPFINQGTATNNNDSQAEIDTGTLGQHLEKQGHTICVNQLMRNGDFSANLDYWSTYHCSTSVSNGILTFTGTASDCQLYHSFACTIGHKYLFTGSFKLSGVPSGNVWMRLDVGTDVDINLDKNNTNWQTLYGIATAISSSSTNWIFRDNSTSDWVSVQIDNCYVIDLTQMFNGDIPQDLLDNPSNFYRYYNGSLDYNTGTLVNSNGRYLVNGGQNILNPNVTYQRVIPNRGYIYKHSSGTSTTITYYDKDKNTIDTASVSSATSPYNSASFITPSNCYYISSSVSTNCMVCLYYSGESYDDVITYEEPKVYDTGDEVLRKAGSVKDTKAPDGTITRNVGYVDLGSLEWTREYNSSYNKYIFRATKPSDAKINTTNIFNPKYTLASDQSTYGIKDKEVYIGSTQVSIRDDSYTDAETFTSAMSGVYLYYELATPTTEQGTPFSENMDINDMGNMAWYSAYTDENTNTLVSVPQGCKIFYPAWYAGFIDSLGQRADIEWSADNVVSQSELSAVDTKHDNLYAIMQENVGGALRHQLASANNVDFLSSIFADLGQLTWTYVSGETYFYATLPNAKNTWNIPFVCSIYKNLGDISTSSLINMGAFIRQGNIYVMNTSYTNATVFKNAMKGVLLAYEKA